MTIHPALQKLIDKIGVPVERGTVQAGAVSTAYLAAGQGAPLVLLHGASSSGISWYPVIGALAARFRVWLPDMVGHGESDRPDAPYDRSYYSSWLAGFFDAVGLDRAHVVGHSLGGAVALQFALEHPERVRRLVLVDAAALGRGVPVRVALAFLRSALLPSREAGERLGRLAVYDPRKLDPFFEEYGSRMRAMPRPGRAFWRGGRTIAVVPTEELQQLKPPTLIVWGREDLFLPVSHGERAAQAIPDARLHVIPEAGHVSFLDQPQAFCEALLGFLAGDEQQDAAGEA